MAIVLGVWLMAAAGVRAEVVASSPLPDPVDDASFRGALRQWGLDAWLDQLATNSPADEAERQLCWREQLWVEAARANASATRRDKFMQEAREVLQQLIDVHPDDRRRFHWRLELARDDLERLRPECFERMLIDDLPGRDRAVVHELSGRAADTLEGLRNDVAAAWRWVGGLDAETLAEVRPGFAVSLLESIDGQSALILAWAKLYRALGEPDEAKQRAAFSDVLTDVTQRYSWTELPAGREVEQCGALVLAAIACRHLERYDDAAAYAARAVHLYPRLPATAQSQLRTVLLTAVLEQIRAVRDARQYDAAAQYVAQAKSWVDSQPDMGAGARVAVALLESTIVDRRTTMPAGSQARLPTTSQPVSRALLGGLYHAADALVPLQKFATESTLFRDALYEVLAPVLAAEQPAREPPSTRHGEGATPFERQLQLGAAVVDALAAPETVPEPLRQRLNATAAAARERLAGSAESISPAQRGELLFLLGRAAYFAGDHLSAARLLADLAEQLPQHDRVKEALPEGFAIAQQALAGGEAADTAVARATFVRVALLMRQHVPEDPRNRTMRYYVAAALERDGRFEQAADEYAGVTIDAQAVAAAAGEVRCLYHMLEAAGPSGAASATVPAETVQRVMRAASRVRQQVVHWTAEPVVEQNASQPAPSATQPESSATRPSTAALVSAQGGAGETPADVVLLLAAIYNHPAVAQPQEALSVLASTEPLWRENAQLAASAWREQTIALQRLGKWADARQAAERFASIDPSQAGPLMAALLRAMHEAMEAAADRGDQAQSQAVAAEAVRVGQALLDGAAGQRAKLKPVDLVWVRLWYGQALVQTGKSEEALAVLDTCEKALLQAAPADSSLAQNVRLAKADALVKSGKPADALPIYASIWQQVPEHTPLWWHALAGNLACHTAMNADAAQIVGAIEQQRFLAPELGGGRWKAKLEALEKQNRERMGSTDAPP